MTSLFWPNVNRSLWSVSRLVSRWRIVKSKESLVNYWLKHDGMIVRIPSSLLLAFMSNFYFAKILITPYILRNVDDWTRHKLKTIFWLRSRFRELRYAVLFLVKNMTSETSFWLGSRKRAPDQALTLKPLDSHVVTLLVLMYWLGAHIEATGPPRCYSLKQCVLIKKMQMSMLTGRSINLACGLLLYVFLLYEEY